MNNNKKVYNIILANSLMNNSNCGCLALTYMSIILIDQIFSSKGYQYKLYLTDSGWQNDCDYEFNVLGKTYKYTTCSYYNGISWKVSLYKKIQDLLLLRRSSKRIFMKCDYILTGGFGDSFSDIYGIERFLYVNHINRIAYENNKPLCFLPQTIGPFYHEDVKKEACKSLSRSCLCMSRDKLSQEFILNNIPSLNKAKEYIDMAFFLPYEKLSFSNENIHIGLNISGLLWNNGYTKNNEFGLTTDYKHLIRVLIDFFGKNPNTIIHIIPHVPDRIKTIDDDYSISYQLWKDCNNNRVILAPFFTNPIEAKNYIAGMDFFLGARMHSTIAAFSSNVPVVPMSYSRKFEGLYNETLNYPYVINLKTMSLVEILDFVSDTFNNRKIVADIIKERMNGVVEKKKMLLIEDLSRFFNIL